jgi:hypothetical protein
VSPRDGAAAGHSSFAGGSDAAAVWAGGAAGDEQAITHASHDHRSDMAQTYAQSVQPGAVARVI